VVEDILHLRQELLVEDELCQPKTPILLHDLFLDFWCNLNLRRNGFWQSAVVESNLRRLTILTCVFAGLCYVWIVGKLLEAILVDKVFPLVNQNVCVVRLHPTLVLKSLNHCQIIGMLFDLAFEVLVFTSKGLLRDV
jgi:hypothetical protein